jgi:hypothetical protein
MLIGCQHYTIQKYFCFLFASIKLKKHRKMKYIKSMLTNLSKSESWWKWHISVSLVVYPLIKVVIDHDVLSSPPVEELIIVGGWHPTTS